MDSHQYVIRVHGHLDQRWEGWLGLTAEKSSNEETRLVGCGDQAALMASLMRLVELGVTVLSVNRRLVPGLNDLNPR